jgi:hypothetical protein
MHIQTRRPSRASETLWGIHDMSREPLLTFEEKLIFAGLVIGTISGVLLMLVLQWAGTI